MNGRGDVSNGFSGRLLSRRLLCWARPTDVRTSLLRETADPLRRLGAPGVALTNWKAERSSRVRPRSLPGFFASSRAPCEVLLEGPVPGRRPIPLPLICETPRSSRRPRVSSCGHRLKAQEFGLWLRLDSWLIPHLEPLASSAPGIDYVSIRVRYMRGKQSQNPHPLVKQTPKGCATQDHVIASRMLHPPEPRQTRSSLCDLSRP